MTYGKIASIGELHEDTEEVLLLFKEGVIVLDDVGVADGSEQPDLIESIFLFPGIELFHFDLLHGQDFALFLMDNFIDSSETPASEFFDNIVILHVIRVLC